MPCFHLRSIVGAFVGVGVLLIQACSPTNRHPLLHSVLVVLFVGMDAMNLDYLRLAAERGGAAPHLLVLNPWDPPTLGLLFRQSCLGTAFVHRAAQLTYEPVDLTTGSVHDRMRDPGLAAAMDAATRAGRGCELLFVAHPLDQHQKEALLLARRLYIKSSVFAALQSMVKEGCSPRQECFDTSVDAFKQRAIVAFLRVGRPSIPRPWAALLNSDVRWCMACPVEEWAALKDAFPQTRPCLEAFGIHREFFPLVETLRRVFDLHATGFSAQDGVEQVRLPELGA